MPFPPLPLAGAHVKLPVPSVCRKYPFSPPLMNTLPTGPNAENPDTVMELNVAAPFSLITDVGGIPTEYPPNELKASAAM